MLALRSFLFQAFFWTWSTLINLAYIPALLMDRKVALSGQEIWARVSFWGLKWIAGLDYEVRGRENIPAGPGDDCEQASVDVGDDGGARAGASSGDGDEAPAAEIPGYGWYARKAKMIVIDREAGPSAIRSMIADAKARLAEGRPIVIFPEGTRREIGAPTDYKPGVAALYSMLDIPCVPMAHNSSLYLAAPRVLAQARQSHRRVPARDHAGLEARGSSWRSLRSARKMPWRGCWPRAGIAQHLSLQAARRAILRRTLWQLQDGRLGVDSRRRGPANSRDRRRLVLAQLNVVTR